MSIPASPGGSAQVFISYSDKDREYLERLQTHLKPHEREGKIRYWADTQIPPGPNWRTAIQQVLASARVGVLLISPDFLASAFLEGETLPTLLGAARNHGVKVLLVHVAPSSIRHIHRLNQIMAINDPTKPLSKLIQAEQDEVWDKLTRYILDVLKTDKEWQAEGDKAYKARRYSEALDAYTHGLDISPNDAELLFKQGETLSQLGREQAAREAYERALQLDSTFSARFIARAEAALKEHGEERFRFWMAVLDTNSGATSQSAMRLLLLKILSNERPDRISWETRALLLQKCSQTTPPIDLARMRPWLVVSWEQLDDLLGLSLQKSWKRVTFGALIEHQTGALSQKAVSMVARESEEFEAVLGTFLNDPARWQSATSFFAKLVLAGYHQKISLLHSLLDKGAMTSPIVEALLQDARLTPAEETDLIEQHSRALLAAPQLAESFVGMIRQYLYRITFADAPHFAKNQFAPITALQARTAKESQGLLATVLLEFASKILREVQRAFQAGNEEEIFFWLDLLYHAAPPRINRQVWIALAQLFQGKPFRNLSRCLWLLQRWGSIARSIDTDQLRAWLELPWEGIDRFLDWKPPETWSSITLLALIERHTGVLLPAQRETIERYPEPFERLLTQLIRRPEKQSLAVVFFGKLATARYERQLSFLSVVLDFTLSDQTLTESLLQAANFTDSEKVDFLEHYSQPLFEARTLAPTFLDWLASYLRNLRVRSLDQPKTVQLLERIQRLQNHPDSPAQLLSILLLTHHWLRLREFIRQPLLTKRTLEGVAVLLQGLPTERMPEIKDRLVEVITLRKVDIGASILREVREDELHRVTSLLGQPLLIAEKISSEAAPIALLKCLVASVGNAHQAKRLFVESSSSYAMRAAPLFPYVRAIFTHTAALGPPQDRTACIYELLGLLLPPGRKNDYTRDAITREVSGWPEGDFRQIWQEYVDQVPRDTLRGHLIQLDENIRWAFQQHQWLYLPAIAVILLLILLIIVLLMMG